MNVANGAEEEDSSEAKKETILGQERVALRA